MRNVSTLYRLILCISIQNKQQFCSQKETLKKCNFKVEIKFPGTNHFTEKGETHTNCNLKHTGIVCRFFKYVSKVCKKLAISKHPVS